MIQLLPKNTEKIFCFKIVSFVNVSSLVNRFVSGEIYSAKAFEEVIKSVNMNMKYFMGGSISFADPLRGF